MRGSELSSISKSTKLKPYEILYNNLLSHRTDEEGLAHEQQTWSKNRIINRLNDIFIGDKESEGIIEYAKRSPFYKNKYEGLGNPENLEELLRDYPKTLPHEIAELSEENRPMDIVPKGVKSGSHAEIITSGTSGAKKRFYFTLPSPDLDYSDAFLAGEIASRVAEKAGIEEDDHTYNLMMEGGSFVSGFIIDYAAMIERTNLHPFGIDYAENAIESLRKHKQSDFFCGLPAAISLLIQEVGKEAVKKKAEEKLKSMLDEYEVKIRNSPLGGLMNSQKIREKFRGTIGGLAKKLVSEDKIKGLQKAIENDSELAVKIFNKAMDKEGIKIRDALVGGDILTPTTYEMLNKVFDNVHNCYAVTEGAGIPWAYGDSSEELRVPFDTYLPAIEDKEGNRKFLWECELGERGELIVVTPYQGSPLVNYVPRDEVEFSGWDRDEGLKMKVIGRSGDSALISGAKFSSGPAKRVVEDVFGTATYWDTVLVDEGGRTKAIFRISEKNRKSPSKAKKELNERIQKTMPDVAAILETGLGEIDMRFLPEFRYPENPAKFDKIKNRRKDPDVNPYEVKVHSEDPVYRK